MAFRRSIPQQELRAKMTPQQQLQHETTYQASRGGHFPAKDKPVPGNPQSNQHNPK
ncbi:hypothetical protein [Streptomyces sp. L2]|uniref:hypothetical protein n=1 Tax=Streptomyces sp. L2 TaxID=2162665 RepID=UPI0013E91FE2|nr:hypothetical protein [Streptomyces sp. L2]